MIKKTKMNLKSVSDDLMLYADVYTPENPKALISIFHGMAEHKERYETLASILASYGCVVFCVDQRGHGESVNETIPFGYFADNNGWQANIEDLHNFSMNMLEKYPNLPFFIIGHSMGSLTAHSYLKRYEDIVSGVVFSGMPAYNSAIPLGRTLAGVLEKLKGGKKVSIPFSKMFDYNKYVKKPNTPYDWISYNVDNVNEYKDDPLCGFPFTIKGYHDLLDGTADVYLSKDWRVLKKELPLLFVVGQDDACADVAKGFKHALNNITSVGYTNIEANIYENMRHEIFNEREKKIVFKDVLAWLDKQIKIINENK